MYIKFILTGIGIGATPLIILLTSPWLSRMYTPEDFGYLALCMAVISFTSSVASFRLDSAVMVVPDSTLNSTVNLAVINVLFSLIFFLAVIFFLSSEVFGYDIQVVKKIS